MATCAYCGKEMIGEDKFCHGCGKPAGAVAAAAVAPVPPPPAVDVMPARPSGGPPEEVELRKLAEKRVNERMGLIWHITAYVIVNGFLVTIWALTGANDSFWFIWPMLGWGIGLAFHIASYVSGRTSPATRERQIQKEMDKI